MFILKGVKVLCFDTLLQVFILKDVMRNIMGLGSRGGRLLRGVLWTAGRGRPSQLGMQNARISEVAREARGYQIQLLWHIRVICQMINYKYFVRSGTGVTGRGNSERLEPASAEANHSGPPKRPRIENVFQCKGLSQKAKCRDNCMNRGLPIVC